MPALFKVLSFSLNITKPVIAPTVITPIFIAENTVEG
jgi:hypothetical protein